MIRSAICPGIGAQIRETHNDRTMPLELRMISNNNRSTFAKQLCLDFLLLTANLQQISLQR